MQFLDAGDEFFVGGVRLFSDYVQPLKLPLRGGQMSRYPIIIVQELGHLDFGGNYFLPEPGNFFPEPGRLIPKIVVFSIGLLK